MNKIDIHSHILPGVDDGSATMDESVEMVRAAYSQGITCFAATSHYSGRYPNDKPDWLRKLCRELECRVRKEVSEEIRIAPGQEIMYTEDIPEMLRQGRLLTMGGGRFVLVEYYPDTPYSLIYRSVRNLTEAGYYPLLAHVERYRALRTEGRTEELIDGGAYLQMNYRSIGGRWYEDTTRWCRKMLKSRQIYVLGTDMHNMNTRKPDIKAAMRWMDHHLTRGYLYQVTYGNAKKILKKELSR